MSEQRYAVEVSVDPDAFETLPDGRRSALLALRMLESDANQRRTVATTQLRVVEARDLAVRLLELAHVARVGRLRRAAT